MIKGQIEDYYIPMKDFGKYAKERQRYLKSIDKKYGTQFSVQELERTGEKKMEGTINEKKDTKSIEYKGYSIDYNIYGKGEYTVQTWDGEDNWFTSEEEAKSFIDGLEESEETEDHFDDDEDEFEPEEDDYEEDDVLLEEAPYSTKDLALAVVDMFNSNQDEKWETAIYDLLDSELLDDMSDRDYDKWIEGNDSSVIQKYIEDNPDKAKEIFRIIADAYGYKNYTDYRSFNDYVSTEGEQEDLGAFKEATNCGAIANVPGKHIRIDIDEDDLPDELDEAYGRRWKPSKAQAQEYAKKMDEISDFCVKNHIRSSMSGDSYYFEIDGQPYRVSNHTVAASNRDAYDEFGNKKRDLYHPEGEVDEVIYITAGKTRIMDIYNDLKTGKKLDRRGNVIG